MRDVLDRRYTAPQFLVFLWLLFLPACTPANISSTPAAPADWVKELGGVVRISLPIKVNHSQFQLSFFDEHGQRQWKTSAVALFPTDVFIVYDADRGTTRVFLARSPHMGCLLNWKPETQSFEDPCYGSRFSIAGVYESGLSPRSLEELPTEVKDQVIWVKNELVYGKIQE